MSSKRLKGLKWLAIMVGDKGSVNLISSSLIVIPFILRSCLIRHASISRAKIKSKGDNGSPYLTPRCTQNRSVVKPL